MPSFLVIGAQRAGSTSLHHYLTQHPSLHGPMQTKGVHWFDTNWDEDPSWYRAHFPRTSDTDGMTFESSPYYLFHPDVPRRVTSVLEDIRVVAVLRDPVDRLWSHYHHEVQRGNEDLAFDDAIAAEATRLAGAEERLLADPGLVDRHHLHHGYVARSTYAPQVARWIAALGAERVHLVDSADLKDDPQSACDLVCEFLGVGASPLEVGTQHNARRYPRLDPDRRQALRRRFAEADDELLRLTRRRFRWMDA